MAYVTQQEQGEELNRPYVEDLPIHEWYRFVLSYPPHLVREYVEKFTMSPDQRVLDPFCGTGTTLVESKKLGIPSIGIEANPVVQFAASVKTNWSVDPHCLLECANAVAEAASDELRMQGLCDEPLFQPLNSKEPDLRTVSEEKQRLLIKNSISPRPLHKALVLMDKMSARKNERAYPYMRLALAKELVYSISNLRFGPEVGVGKIKSDAPVIRSWQRAVISMAEDLFLVRELDGAPATVVQADARQIGKYIRPNSIDAVITSPPYPNEKDYSRTTRLESVLLDFMTTRQDLRKHKKQFIRSNTRGVYKADTDERWTRDFPRVQELADEIEQTRVDLGKTSGFEKLYASVVRHYFGGMARHLQDLKPLLRPGAQLAYVVGDQASYFRIHIKTGEILADIASRLGFEISNIDLFRTRFYTATRSELREEVVLLKWNP